MLLSIADVFIKKPVLTTVCTIVILLLGFIATPLLPLAKLPELAPKQVSVSASFTGADAKTTADNVTTPLERQINGTEQVIYMSSTSDNTGNSRINVSFPVEIDRNIAQVLVQNQVSQASSNLPPSVIQNGVTTQKQSPSITIVYGIYSDKDAQGKFIYDSVFISNYVDRFITDELKRVNGVGAVTIIGQRQYAMRFWLDPNALAARGLTAQDVVNAITEQNLQVGSGGLGQAPSNADQQFQIALRAVGRFTTPEEAENIVVKVGSDGTLIRIKDVGRVEMGAQDYSQTALFDNAPSVALIVYQLPGSNAWNTAAIIKEKMAVIENNFPPGLKAAIGLDSTLFVGAALNEAVKTLTEAILLVLLVIFIFLQNWRTTIIPAIAIPVSLLGTMAFALIFGFSLNQLTLFAVILATGLVVDDGIVIVEAIEVKLAQGMRPFQAALDAMSELTGAVLATSIVLMAVFIPVTFFPGTTGIVYKQFALIIVFAVAVSTFNAISFSPSLGAIIMRPKQQPQGPLGLFFGVFNRFFDWVKSGYAKIVEFLIHVRLLVIPVFIIGIVATGWLYTTTPQGFISEEDQGYFFIIVDAPASVSVNYTVGIVNQITKEILEPIEAVEHVVGMAGFGFEGSGSNKGLFFVKLKSWEERPGQENSVFGLLRDINQQLRQKITGARAIAVNAPPVDGLSSTGGLEFFIQNRARLPMEDLISKTQEFMAEANKRPELAGVFTQFTFNSPMLEIAVDRNLAKAQNIPINAIFNTLQTYLGSNYVNQFVLDGFLYRVFAQAEASYRSNPQDIGRLYVRSLDGALVQLNNLVKVKSLTYPPIVSNYNIYPAIKVQVSPAPGYSSGQAIAAMEEVADELLTGGFGYEWTGTAFQEKSSGGAAPVIFGLAFIMVFLVLAAQYESYVDPTIIMITVPLAILGALGAIIFRANVLQAGTVWPVLNNNIYVQVALVMLIGMASKNAILIVEFANQALALGMSIPRAAIYAAEERLRPILMTAISGLVGFLPLVIASGAGAMSRWALGTAIFGGYLISTVLSLFLVPVLYVVIKQLEASFLSGGGKSGKGGTSKQPKPSSEPKPIENREEEEEGAVPIFKASPQNE